MQKEVHWWTPHPYSAVPRVCRPFEHSMTPEDFECTIQWPVAKPLSSENDPFLSKVLGFDSLCILDVVVLCGDPFRASIFACVNCYSSFVPEIWLDLSWWTKRLLYTVRIQNGANSIPPIYVEVDIEKTAYPAHKEGSVIHFVWWELQGCWFLPSTSISPPPPWSKGKWQKR